MRMTQIMWLTHLAPDIQEAILFLPRVESEPDTGKEMDMWQIARMMDWGVQRERWHDLFATAKSPKRGNEIHVWTRIRGKVDTLSHSQNCACPQIWSP